MRKIYEEFFHIPQDGKIRENVMVMRVVLTVATMVMCLAAMSITAYAYFSHDITSGSHVFSSAVFETKVAVELIDADGHSISVQSITDDYRKHWVALEAGEVYTITIRPNSDKNANTGFIVVTASDCAAVYHTQQLGADAVAEGGRNEVITFKMAVTANTEVCFDSNWGTSSHYAAYQELGDQDEFYITMDEEVLLQIDREAPPVVDDIPNENEIPVEESEDSVD